MGEKEKRNGLCTVERRRTEDGSSVKNRLIWVAKWSYVTSRPVLQPRAMPQSMILLQLGSGMMSVVHVTTKSCEHAYGLGHYLRPHWYLRATLPLGSY